MPKIASLLLILLVACSCRLSQVPNEVVTPAQAQYARSGTVKITALSDEGGWFATGWVIANDGTDSIIATAGHVCEPGAVYGFRDSDGNGYFGANLWDDDARDLCLLYAPFTGSKTVLKVSNRNSLEFGERLWYTGYPAKTIALVEGRVTGITDEGQYIASLQVYFGASGSAVLDARGDVVGVVSAVYPHFTNTSFHSKNVRLLRALAEAHLRYGTKDYSPDFQQ